MSRKPHLAIAQRLSEASDTDLDAAEPLHNAHKKEAPAP